LVAHELLKIISSPALVWLREEISKSAAADATPSFGDISLKIDDATVR
jgi:hypothetical protein